MNEPDFPRNSDVSKKSDKNIQRVTSSDAVRKKRSLRKQFQETFIAGDAKSAVQFVVMDVLIPASKDMIFDGVTEGFRKLIFGMGSQRRGPTHPQSGGTGFINYQRMASSAGAAALGNLRGPERALSRRARAAHNFDEIVIESRDEAEQVIDKLYEVVSQYDQATVADLYELVGLQGTHADQRWGWTDLRGSGVSRIRGGYLLDLPDPHPLN